ncbi:MAG: gamma-glutamyl-phosphate reductase, partial [Candidatus Gracilibacteria bacterium]
MNLEVELKKTKQAGRKLVSVSDKEIAGVLIKLAGLLRKNRKSILAANRKDLLKINKNSSIYDRILLNDKRIDELADGLEIIAKYKSPIGRVLEEKTLKNGLKLKKVSVPLGVVGVIFEARPNITIDVFALCFKAKNACVMKGGSDCTLSNEIFIKMIKKALGKKWGDAATLLPNDRKLVAKFMHANDYVDVLIPRGGAGLI